MIRKSQLLALAGAQGPGLMPIETLDEIDAIRETMELGPLAEYAARMGIENLEELRVIDCE